MHELAVCQALIDQVAQIAQDRGARQVVSITVSVGVLSGVEPKLLQHAFPLAAAGSRAEHATLVVESIPVKIRCRTCRAESEAEPNRLLCGACRDWQVDVVSGEQLLLKSVELESVARAV